jgi:hypothetical protein
LCFNCFFLNYILIDIPLIDKALAMSAAKATIARKQTVRNILEESVERKKIIKKNYFEISIFTL